MSTQIEVTARGNGRRQGASAYKAPPPQQFSEAAGPSKPGSRDVGPANKPRATSHHNNKTAQLLKQQRRTHSALLRQQDIENTVQ